MEKKIFAFALGASLGMVIPFVPYFLSKKGKNMAMKMKDTICECGNTLKQDVKEMTNDSMASLDGTLETINDKIDDIIDNLSSIDFSKIKAKSKSSIDEIIAKLKSLKVN